MNVLCHSSVIEIDSDDNESIVFAASQSGEEGTSISERENLDECKEILKKVIADCGTVIKKKPITITVFHGSCFNDFHRHFVNPVFKKRLLL